MTFLKHSNTNTMDAENTISFALSHGVYGEERKRRYYPTIIGWGESCTDETDQSDVLCLAYTRERC